MPKFSLGMRILENCSGIMLVIGERQMFVQTLDVVGWRMTFHRECTRWMVVQQDCKLIELSPVGKIFFPMFKLPTVPFS